MRRHGQGQGQGGGGGQDSDNGKEQYTILYTNARSVLNKIEQLRTVVYDRNPAFVMICESFTRDDISDAYLSIDGYELVVRQDGRDTMGGKCRGLLIYAKDGIKAAKIENKQFETVTEIAGITVPGGQGELISLVLVYRPPVAPGSETDMGNTDKLCQVMRELKGPQVWVGDFNLHIDWERGYAPITGEEIVMQTVQDLFWEQLVDFPTHVKDGMLDLVLRSRSDLVGEVRSEGYLAPGADHHMLEFELCGPARSLGSEEMVPDWSKADMVLLKERLELINWEDEGKNLGAEQSGKMSRRS